jgi:glycosyltransferase involved in cell wall biosynthesis
MKPIRILQVFASMERGGAETMIMNIYRKINKSKIQFDFLVHTSKRCAYDEEIELMGGRIYNIPKYSYKNHYKYVDAFRSFLISHPEHKIVHGHYFTISPIYFRVAKKLNRKCIAHSHNALQNSSLKSILFKALFYPIKHLIDYKFACTNAAGEWMYGKRVDDFIVLKNAINVNNFLYDKKLRIELRKEWNLENKFVIGHIGRFFKQKNHDYLIDIFNEVAKKDENAFLLLVGDGELEPQIKKKVRNLNLESKVIFTGSRSDVSNLLHIMDTFVLPSHYEGLGMVLIEAQTSGLKCFASKKVVPFEAKVTQLLEFISLDKSPEYWANMIIRANDDYVRRSMENEVKLAGYDVALTSNWLENFYLEINQKS